jgi:CMP/dCMP kinase
VKRLVVAIDGPAGAGKSTVTRRVAEALCYTVVDTGALYRAVAYAAKQRQVPWNDADGVARVAEQLARAHSIEFGEVHEGQTRVLLDGVDVSQQIRTAEMSQGASQVSAIPEVRDALLSMQRSLGARGGVVLEGRDIGTVVFPHADAKFYLTANVDVRTERRYQEHVARGDTIDRARVRREVLERDARDTQRPVAPLRQAPDAILVDSSTLSIDAVVEHIVAKVRALEVAANRPAGVDHDV